jgi:cell division protein FtsQ
MKKMNSPLEIPSDIKYINGLTNVLLGFFSLLLIAIAVQYVVKNKISNLSSLVIKGDVAHNDISSIRNKLNSTLNGNFYNIELLKTKQAFESIAWINQAVVKRVYPDHIEVELSEFKPIAIWGSRDDLKLIDEQGVVFEADADETEYDQIPQFIGPDGQGKVILEMYKHLGAAFMPLQYKLKILEVTARGSWMATLEGGARIELGRGSVASVVERANKFANSAEQMLIKLNKKIIDIEYIDLRHTDGYAMRLHGVTTLDLTAINASIKK